jgi:hypothetical protein
MAGWIGCGWPSFIVGRKRSDRHPYLATFLCRGAGRPEAQTLTFQPIAALSIGGGYYVRSSGIWSFDIANNKALIPVGVGFGKVLKIGKAIVNASIEPQFTVYHDGTGLPSFQLFTGLYFLFRKKGE